MQESKPCHCLLTPPSALRAMRAEEHAKKMFKRVLANWAQDLLMQLQLAQEKVPIKHAA
jgi:hypothetical protein|tara:strand:+ start:99 stop:275 length:177 start_codon:yes stop_codon:yes gene_type:complete